MVRHSSKFPILPDGAYIQVLDMAALCHPTLNLLSFNEIHCGKILCLTKMAVDWEKELNEILEGNLPDWYGSVKESLDFADKQPTTDAFE